MLNFKAIVADTYSAVRDALDDVTDEGEQPGEAAPGSVAAPEQIGAIGTKETPEIQIEVASNTESEDSEGTSQTQASQLPRAADVRRLEVLLSQAQIDHRQTFEELHASQQRVDALACEVAEKSEIIEHLQQMLDTATSRQHAVRSVGTCTDPVWQLQATHSTTSPDDQEAIASLREQSSTLANEVRRLALVSGLPLS